MGLTQLPEEPVKRRYYEDKRDRQFHKDFQYDIALGWIPRDRATVVRIATVRRIPTTTRTGHRARQDGSRSAASGDGNDSSDPEPDPDPERRTQPLQIYDQAALAALLKISKKTLQNQYSAAPHTLPPAIAIPGARGPRWTLAAVQAWLADRPAHVAKPAPKAAKRKAGRPRIAQAVAKGVRS